MSEQSRVSGAGGTARRILTARVPAWVLAVAVVAVAGALGVLVLAERNAAVELGPAVGGAQRVEVVIDICNGEVDRREINPRRAELDLQDTLVAEGAEAARVVVERRDCPTDTDGQEDGGG